jgi:dipeptidyl aminopeptidase/acylaminoacyl peptidase
MKNLVIILLTVATLSASAQLSGKRKLRPSDVYRLKSISDVHISPDSKWVCYALTSVDSAKDKRNTNLWMVSWDGKETMQLTYGTNGASSPKWSPDGKYLSFSSSREGKKSQVWVMDRRGGEARKLTDLKSGTGDYVWSPDGTKLALTIQDPPDTSKTKTAKPMVIDRYQFKADVQGYLMNQRTHLYIYDIASGKLDTLTSGNYNEGSPVWSPDGKQLAFVSNRTAEPDRNENSDIWIVDAIKNAKPRQLTTWTGPDNSPRWSPDGKSIAFLRSTSPDTYVMYDQNILAVIPAAGGEPKLLTASLDRPVSAITWDKSGSTLSFLVSDDRQRYIGRIAATGGTVSKVAGGERSYSSIEAGPAGSYAVLMSEPQLPGEIYAVENGTPRRLTKHQDEFVSPIAFASVQGFTSKSKDGTLVSNILFKPADAKAGEKMPTVFFIHGGPVGQDEFGFDLSRQMIAAAGYAVVGVNYRGSDGRGIEFCKAIYADWGNKEVIDIHGAADHLVKEGIADPERLGIGGWSYGGILTNYSIATDTRFKAAASGAGSALQLSLYGHDQYINQYENELGVPWKNLDKYLKLSYPLLKADKIKTPTLFLVGEKDFNVPALGSEQMYQALRSQNIPTGLIIYPGQFHGITTPSYQIDRFDRYVGWFDKHLKGITPVKINKEVR